MQIAYKDAINETAFLSEPETAQEIACITLICALFILPRSKVEDDLDKKRRELVRRKEALAT